jgi:hypothetical protein
MRADQLGEARLVDTALGRQHDVKRRTLLRLASGADHASSYMFSASDRARGVTGTIIVSDGGSGDARSRRPAVRLRTSSHGSQSHRSPIRPLCGHLISGKSKRRADPVTLDNRKPGNPGAEMVNSCPEIKLIMGIMRGGGAAVGA